MNISEHQFIDLSREYNLIPLYQQWMADTETPVTVYQKLHPLKPAYLLESVEGGEHIARYSFIGLNPINTFTSRGSQVSIISDNNVRNLEGSPLDLLQDLLVDYNCPSLPGLPRFYGGFVGYIGYDVAATLEKLPQPIEGEPQLPDSYLVLCETVLIFDHLKHNITAVINCRVNRDTTEEQYQQALIKLAQIRALLSKNIPTGEQKPLKLNNLAANSNQKMFSAAVNQAKEHIVAGDVFQVVLSQRFSGEYSGDPFQVYRRLRCLNPSPYMYFFDFCDISIVGASPEMLVRVENGIAQARPIAGTRPRGKNEKEDKALAEDLLTDEKERAEHVMLVDLGRNDLGRVCQPGSIQVDSFMGVEYYSHVMHLVTKISGKLKVDKKPLDAFKAFFPAGTVSGAPKIKAMEIINKLETTKRGPYAGAICYLGYNDVLDSAITIRTIVFHKDRAYFQAGAGIVADSNPVSEYFETINKATAVARALGVTNLEEV